MEGIISRVNCSYVGSSKKFIDGHIVVMHNALATNYGSLKLPLFLMLR